AEGRGFDSDFSGQRPFYSLFLALFHQCFGSHIWVSLAANCLCHAITGTVVLILGGCLCSRFVAFVVAGWILLSPTQVVLTQVILTENMGAVFGALGVLLFWRLLREQSIRAALLSGSVVGIGNLASGAF